MNKHLLVDYTPFVVSANTINESIKNNNGKLIVSGVLQRADAKNQNGRIYPKSILEREVDKYDKGCVSTNRALGELDHPDSSVVNLANVSHNILEVWWNNNDVMGKIEILETPAGRILKELFKAGINVGISSRGLGSVKNITEDTVEVQDDLEFIAWDFVSTPSTQGAFMAPINEGVNNHIEVNKYESVNKIITDIILSKNTKI